MTITLRIILIIASLFSCFLCIKRIKQSKLKIENDCLKFKLESTKKLLQKIKDYCDDIGMIIDGYKSDAERYWSCFILVFIYSEL